MDWTEIAGFITGAACVWLLVRGSIWNFPVGMVNYVLFIILFVNAGLYADAGLQVVYFVLASLGWYWWLKGGKEHEGVEYSDPSPLQFAGCAIAIIVIAASLQWLLHRYTDSTVAGWDALTTAMSLTAQFMLSRKWFKLVALDRGRSDLYPALHLQGTLADGVSLPYFPGAQHCRTARMA